ncbi:MAG: AarF/ABC1/UbiB kinase family protein [Leptospiraceae bacterium]|nr:AarF/ABC1/UbiB kinase family protein [Leptospiraceae bacterium]
MELFSNLRLGINGTLRILDSTRVLATKLGSVLIELAEGSKKPDLPVKLREGFEELGATYIKLGQFIASAPSIFPKEFTKEMDKCLDSVRPIPYTTIKYIVEKELGGKIEDHFQSFEEKPIASASISQVHGAVTKNGLDVVVKVQRPDIEDTLKTDMTLISIGVLLFSKLNPSINSSGILDIVKDFHDNILLETDFIQEAKNIEEFDEYLLKAGESRARVPRVYKDFSTKKVLTMERFYGVPLTDLNSIRKYTKNPEATLMNALNIWFESLGSCGLFHADVHAGNLLLLNDGKIGFIDFGIVGRISTDVWQGLMFFMNGIGMGEADLMAKGLVMMDSTTKGIDEKKFAEDLGRVIKEFEEIAESVRGKDITEFDEDKLNTVMFDIADISKRNGLKIPREFGLLIKQMLYFDRYAKILAPEVDLIKDQKRYLPK